MSQYKLTLLGKTVILVLVFAVVMLVVTISTLSYNERTPAETPTATTSGAAAPTPGAAAPTPETVAPGATSTPETTAPPSVADLPGPVLTPTPSASPSSIPLPTNTPAPSSVPSADSTAMPPPSKPPVNAILNENAVIYFTKASSEPDVETLAEIRRFALMPENIEDYILVITASTSPDEGDTPQRQALSRERALFVMEYLKSLGLSEQHMTIVLGGAEPELTSGDPDIAALSRNVKLNYIINMK